MIKIYKDVIVNSLIKQTLTNRKFISFPKIVFKNKNINYSLTRFFVHNFELKITKISQKDKNDKRSNIKLTHNYWLLHI